MTESMKMKQPSMAGCVTSSLPRRNLEIPTVTDDCGAGKDTRLNDRKQSLGSAISNRCKTVLPDSCSTLTKTHAVARSMLQLHCTQHAATTFSSAQAALIYFHNFAKLTTTHHEPKKKAIWKSQNKD
jgi:hypothetical protein